MHGDKPKRELFLDRPLPSSEEAERAVLGGILLDNRLMADASEAVTVADLYSPLHRRVYAAMLALHEQNQPIDPIMIGEEIKKNGPVESIGGVAAIANLTYGLPHFTNIDEFTQVIVRKSNLRKLISFCNEFTTKALDEDEAVFEQAQARINDLAIEAETGQTAEKNFIALERVIDNEVLDALEKLRDGITPKVKIGFPGIDAAVGGISPSDVMLVAATTGSGKSAFALQTAFQLARTGTPTAFLAGEMTNLENVLRLLSQQSGITNVNSLSHLTDDEYKMLVQWAIHIRETPIFFDHRVSDLTTLRTHLRGLVKRHGVKVLVIDYIQLFKMEKMDRRQRVERIAEVSQETKRIANELDISIIEVAQFNRQGSKSGAPTMHDLDGSGQLEKDASLILIMDVSETELTDSSYKKYRPVTVKVAKGRNVGTWEIEGRYYGKSVRFEFPER